MIKIVKKSEFPWFDRHFGTLLHLELAQILKDTVRAGAGIAGRLLVIGLQLLQCLRDGQREGLNTLHKLWQDAALEVVLRVGVATGEDHKGILPLISGRGPRQGSIIRVFCLEYSWYSSTPPHGW